MYVGKDSSAELSEEQKDGIIGLIPTLLPTNVSSFDPKHMIADKACLFLGTSYVRLSKDKVELLTPDEIEYIGCAYMILPADILPLHVVSFRIGEVTIVYGREPVTVSPRYCQQVQGHFETQARAEKMEWDKKNGKGSNVEKRGESDSEGDEIMDMSFLNTSKNVEGGMGDESNDMDISLVNDGTIIDGVGGAEIGVANMSLSLDESGMFTLCVQCCIQYI